MSLKKSAHLSHCRQYRYALWRSWDEHKPYVLFICLNPSTADAHSDDPTLRRCIQYAKSWGYGRVCMANLFAYRATKPADMKAVEDPIGRQNDRWLKKLSKNAGLIIAAWGNDGQYLDRSTQVKKRIPELHYLGLNKSGEPTHPLYQKADLQPSVWQAAS